MSLDKCVCVKCWWYIRDYPLLFFRPPNFSRIKWSNHSFLKLFNYPPLRKKYMKWMWHPDFFPLFRLEWYMSEYVLILCARFKSTKEKKSHNEPHDLQIFRKKTHMTWLCGLLPTNSQSFCLHRDCLIGFLSYYSTVSLSPHQQNWAPFVS